MDTWRSWTTEVCNIFNNNVGLYQRQLDYVKDRGTYYHYVHQIKPIQNYGFLTGSTFGGISVKI